MKRIAFHADTNRSGGILHIETDMCIVEPTRYRVREEGGAETTIATYSLDEAISEAREYVESGSYDAPGVVLAWITEIGPDGDGLSGTTRTITVRVGR